MGKVQTRRSISVTGLTYQRLKDYCDARNVSVSGTIEDLVKDHLDREGAPKPTVLRPRTPRRRRVTSDDIPPQNLTF